MINSLSAILSLKMQTLALSIIAVLGSVYYGSAQAEQFGDKEYRWIKERKTQEEAQAYAETLGGHLAVINSAAEDDFVYSIVRDASLTGLGIANDGGGVSYVWLGGNDANSEGNWVWINGDPFEYTNWGRAEPDNYLDQDGLAMGLQNWPDGSSGNAAYGLAGEWNDISRSNQLTFIVELPSDDDGIGDNSDVFPDNATVRGSQFLQTTSASANITRLHVLNTSDREQTFSARMFDGNGDRVGGTPLIGDPVPPMGRLMLTSEYIEELFDTEPWQGPAMLEVGGESTFDVMSKLISPSGLVSNTNCVREDRVLNIEGFDSNNMSYVRLINTINSDSGEITGTLYDAEGNVVGNANSLLASNLAPYQQVWVNRDDLADQVGTEWNGEALLEVNQVTGLKLLNLNYITDEQTFL